MSTEHGGFPGAYHVKQCTIRSQFIRMAPLCVRARGGGSWRYLYYTPFSLWFGSFELCGLWQLVRTATSVTLPPGWRRRQGVRGGGRWQRWKGCYEGCCVRGGWDDRLGRPTPEHFHKSRVSKQASVCGKPRNPEECTPSTGGEGVLQASVGVKGCRGTILSLEGQNYGLY